MKSEWDADEMDAVVGAHDAEVARLTSEATELQFQFENAAEAARQFEAEVTRLRSVIAEAVALEGLMVNVYVTSQTPENRWRVEHSKDLLRILAKASQTGEGEEA